MHVLRTLPYGSLDRRRHPHHRAHRDRHGVPRHPRPHRLHPLRDHRDPSSTSSSVGAIRGMRRSAQLVRPHFWLVFFLVSIPLFLEHQAVHWASELVLDHSLVEVFLVQGITGMIVGSFVGLVEVNVAYALELERNDGARGRSPPTAKRYPRPRNDLAARDRARRDAARSHLRAATRRLRRGSASCTAGSGTRPSSTRASSSSAGCASRPILGSDAERAIRFGDGADAGVTEAGRHRAPPLADVRVVLRWRARLHRVRRAVRHGPARAHRRALRRAARAPRRTRARHADARRRDVRRAHPVPARAGHRAHRRPSPPSSPDPVSSPASLP